MSSKKNKKTEDDSKGFTLHQMIVQAGLAQKQTRLEKRSDRFWGKGLADDEMTSPWITSTSSITTDIKRLLPANECRWLFMRVIIKSVIGSRLSMEVVLLDENLDLIALSQQICQVIPKLAKEKRRGNL